MAFACSKAGAGYTSLKMTLDAGGGLSILAGVDQDVGVHTVIQRVAAQAQTSGHRVTVRRRQPMRRARSGVGAAWHAINGRATEEAPISYANCSRRRPGRPGATGRSSTSGRAVSTTSSQRKPCADGPLAVGATSRLGTPLPSDYMFTALTSRSPSIVKPARSRSPVGDGDRRRHHHQRSVTGRSTAATSTASGTR